MRNLDFSSWSGLLSTLLGLALITLLGMGLNIGSGSVVHDQSEDSEPKD
jgi:hypothetical protein